MPVLADLEAVRIQPAEGVGKEPGGVQHHSDQRRAIDDAHHEALEAAIGDDVPEDVHGRADRGDRDEDRIQDLEDVHVLVAGENVLADPDDDEREERNRDARELALAELPAPARGHHAADRARQQPADEDAAAAHGEVEEPCVRRGLGDGFNHAREGRWSEVEVQGHGRDWLRCASKFATKRSVTAGLREMITTFSAFLDCAACVKL